jgi:hypothetical protein
LWKTKIFALRWHNNKNKTYKNNNNKSNEDYDKNYVYDKNYNYDKGKRGVALKNPRNHKQQPRAKLEKQFLEKTTKNPKSKPCLSKRQSNPKAKPEHRKFTTGGENRGSRFAWQCH